MILPAKKTSSGEAPEKDVKRPVIRRMQLAQLLTATPMIGCRIVKHGIIMAITLW